MSSVAPAGGQRSEARTAARAGGSSCGSRRSTPRTAPPADHPRSSQTQGPPANRSASGRRPVARTRTRPRRHPCLAASVPPRGRRRHHPRSRSAVRPCARAERAKAIGPARATAAPTAPVRLTNSRREIRTSAARSRYSSTSTPSRDAARCSAASCCSARINGVRAIRGLLVRVTRPTLLHTTCDVKPDRAQAEARRSKRGHGAETAAPAYGRLRLSDPRFSTRSRRPASARCCCCCCRSFRPSHRRPRPRTTRRRRHRAPRRSSDPSACP